ncbi:hypothetical protein HPB50_014287 [Hyalomma asiaticum]|uniref:Uncharacterized protein n=1 Tax=Hyalomma asiaticum TaxID=266040 RepID=A0ACB7TMQ7_HYAAI|nr:hypothetical protein HPB50_014287 [Hyalomma asiaticum]
MSGARPVTLASEDRVVQRYVDQMRERSSDTDANRECSNPEGSSRTTKEVPKCEDDDIPEKLVLELHRYAGT